MCLKWFMLRLSLLLINTFGTSIRTSLTIQILVYKESNFRGVNGYNRVYESVCFRVS